MSETVAVVAPAATEREAGVSKSALLLLRPIATPPAGAACERTVLHVLAFPELRVVGLHVSDARVAGGLSVKVLARELPFRVAVRTAVWAVEMAPAVTATAKKLAPAATVREAGVNSISLLLLRLTTAPPAGAACESPAMQVLRFPEVSVVGVHVKEARVAAGLSVKLLVLELPFRVAARTAVCVVKTVPALSPTAASVAPAATAREGGGHRNSLLLLRPMTAPPAGAACESTAIHVVPPPGPSVVGLHVSEARVAELGTLPELAGGLSVKLTVLELPFRVAVNTAVCAAEMAPAVSETAAVVAPAATVRKAGVPRSVLLLLRPIAVPPAGAACESTALHVPTAAELSAAGLQVREDRASGGLSVKLAVAELPFRVAVKIAVWVAETVPAVSETVAVVAPAATVRKAGVPKSVLLLLRLIAAPPAGAACERTALQVLVPAELSVVGVHVSEARLAEPDTLAVDTLPELAGGLSVKLTALELPFKVAVKTAVCAAEIVPAVSETVAAVAPAATLRDAGVPKSVLLLLRPTTAPPDGAACEMTALQMLTPAELSAAGLHVSEASVGRTEMVPPAAATLTELAGADAASALERAMFVLTALAASVNCAVTTNPFAMTLSLGPVATQVYIPALAAQVMVLEAAVRPAAGLTVIAVMFAAGYWKVHCRPATWLVLPGSLNVRPRATVPPATAVPDARDRVVCAQHVQPARARRVHRHLHTCNKALTWCSIRGGE